MASGDLVGRVVRLDSSRDGRGNFHDYVAVAYAPDSDEYLLLNFTTPIGDGNPFSIKIARREFPLVLKHESEVEFRRPEQMSAADLRAQSRKAPNGTFCLCPWAVIQKIKNKISAGTEMPRMISQKYGL